MSTPTRNAPITHRPAAIAALAAALAIPLLMLTVDQPVRPWLNAMAETHWAAELLTAVKGFGDELVHVGAAVIALIIAALGRWRPMARMGALILLTFMGTGLGSYGIKALVRRPRPWTEDIRWGETIADWSWAFDGRAHSFPSGDVSVATGLAMLLFLSVGRGRARYLVFLMPALSMAGRLAGARHYPSDCLGGLLLGMGVAWVLWRLWPERPRAMDRASPE